MRDSDLDRRRRRSRSRSPKRDRGEDYRRRRSKRERSSSRSRSRSRDWDRRSRRDREKRSRSRSPDARRDHERDRDRERIREKERDREDKKPIKTLSSSTLDELSEPRRAAIAEEMQEQREKEKAAEMASLEEEMRRRREKVRLWQEARAKQQQQQQQEESAAPSSSTTAAATTFAVVGASPASAKDQQEAKSVVAVQETPRRGKTKVKTEEAENGEDGDDEKERPEEEPVDDEQEVEMEGDEQEEEKPRWTLEDDDEDADAVSEADPAGAEAAENVPLAPLAPLDRAEPEGDELKAFSEKKAVQQRSRLSRWQAVQSSGSQVSPAISMNASAASSLPLPTPPLVSAPAETTWLETQTLPEAEDENDALDDFMKDLMSSGDVAAQKGLKAVERDTIQKRPSLAPLHSIAQPTRPPPPSVPPPSHPAVSSIAPSSVAPDMTSSLEDEYEGINFNGSNVITLDEIMGKGRRGWESDAAESAAASPTPDAGRSPFGRRANRRGPTGADADDDDDEDREGNGQNARSEEELERERVEFMAAIRKAREEEERSRERLVRVEEEQARRNSKVGGGSDLGRIFSSEGDIADEVEVENKKRSALELLEEAKRGKMLKPVDHSKIQYLPFRKNLYIVPKALAKLSEAELLAKRDSLQIKVRGRGCPAPVDTWEQCGLSDRILQTIAALKLKDPFPIQQQALPAIMCGRDCIGVAKTGSGKTLAFLLPMFRHIQDQPPLGDGEGPIGLIMAPARELAFQIYNEAKKFTKGLGMRVACIYGGASVAEQIADLRRGSEIVVCTPGRMIDILCMQAGRLISLRRVTMVVLDEADRMFDMGFEPQIRMIITNTRPDRQTILFSATFPKQIEKLAKQILKLPLEIIVGERSSVNKDITQYIEVHEEADKFLRLLQLLGIYYTQGSTLVFVDKQEKSDQLFHELLKLGYPCLSLHGGKDQVDRDHTLHEFKTGIKTVLIATSVAGRGLDVPEVCCVINYNVPNHLEDYVHRVGRTGRAGRKGTAYTFISSKEEQHAPIMVKALQKAGQPIPEELQQMMESFKQKVERGEAHFASNGFVGKGFTFDASEMNEAQRIAQMQRRAYEVEQGLVQESDIVEEDLDDYPAGSALVGEETSSAGGESRKGAADKNAVVALSSGQQPPPPPTPPPLHILQQQGLIGGNGAGGAGDAMAAVAKARHIAMQLVNKRAKDSTVSDHFVEELEINDYPVQVRRKVTAKHALDDISESTRVAIIARGTYVPPGKKVDISERKLHLVIEGTSEMGVRQAKLEIQRQLEEETIRMSASSLGGGGMGSSLGGGPGGGRYSVI